MWLQGIKGEAGARNVEVSAQAISVPELTSLFRSLATPWYHHVAFAGYAHFHYLSALL